MFQANGILHAITFLRQEANQTGREVKTQNSPLSFSPTAQVLVFKKWPVRVIVQKLNPHVT